ncbi:MAG: hypothetical protein D6798_00150 [Deltaproteobacteria bacterium]|nr:MAG: hypothetical protein D6798_00150 [Deltaproteobacteria bacterium]
MHQTDDLTPTSSSVTASEIRAYLRKTGDMPAAATEALAPGIEGEERQKLMWRVEAIRRKLVKAGELDGRPPTPRLRVAQPLEPAEPDDYDDDVEEGEADPACPNLADLTVVEQLTWTLARLRAAVAVGTPGSVAYVKALKDIRDTHRELQEAKQAAAAAGEKDPAELTPEEWRAEVEADAAEATDEDLEIYVREWLSRHKYSLVVNEVGELELRYDGGTR